VIWVKVTLSVERSILTPVWVVEVLVQERLIWLLPAAVAARLVGAVGGGGACVVALAYRNMPSRRKRSWRGRDRNRWSSAQADVRIADCGGAGDDDLGEGDVVGRALDLDAGLVVEVLVQERLIWLLLAAVAAKLVGAVGGGDCVVALAVLEYGESPELFVARTR